MAWRSVHMLQTLIHKHTKSTLMLILRSYDRGRSKRAFIVLKQRLSRAGGDPPRLGRGLWPAIDFPGITEEQLLQHGLRGADLLQQPLLHRGDADRADSRLARAVAAINQLFLVPHQEFRHELRIPHESTVA